MVILGGLELVAAGVIIHKYTKNKEARLEEERQEERRRRERKHNRKNSKRHDSRPPKDGDPSAGLYPQPMNQSQPPRAQSAPPPGYTPPQWQPQGPAQPGYYPPQPWPQQQQPPPQFNKNVPNWLPRQQPQNGYAPNWQAPIPQPQAQVPPQPQMQQRPREEDTFYDNPNNQRKDVEAGFPSNPSYERLPQAQHTGSSVQLPLNPQPRPLIQNQMPQPWQVQPLCAELSGESHRLRQEQEHDAHSDTASTRYAPTEFGDERYNEPPPVYQPYRSDA